jgi:hypothetical protein
MEAGEQPSSSGSPAPHAAANPPPLPLEPPPEPPPSPPAPPEPPASPEPLPREPATPEELEAALTQLLAASAAAEGFSAAAAAAVAAVDTFNAQRNPADLWRAQPFVEAALFAPAGGQPPAAPRPLLFLLTLAGASALSARGVHLARAQDNTAGHDRAPACSLQWLTPPKCERLLALLAGGAGGAAPACAALRQLSGASPALAALAPALTHLAQRNAGARPPARRAWLAASPLLVSSAWGWSGAQQQQPRPRLPDAAAAAAAALPSLADAHVPSPEEQDDFVRGVAAAAAALAADAAGAPWEAAVLPLVCTFAASAPTTACLAAVLAQPWATRGRRPAPPGAAPPPPPPLLLAAHASAGAALDAAVAARYAALLRASGADASVSSALNAAPVGGGAWDVGGDGGVGAHWRGVLAPAWGAALASALQRAAASARAPAAAAGDEEEAPLPDALRVAAAVAAMPLDGAAAHALLDAAAALAAPLPELLPLLLRRADGGAPAVAAAAPAAAAHATRAWLRGRAPGGAAASASALFDAMRLFSSLIPPAAPDAHLHAALQAEAADAAARAGLPAVMAALRQLACEAGSGEEARALRIVRSLAAALPNTAAARDAIAVLVPPAPPGAPPAAHVPTPLVAAAVCAVLDRFGDGVTLEAPAAPGPAAPTVRDVLLRAGGAFWAPLAWSHGACAPAVRAHPAAARALGLVAAFGASLRSRGATVAAFRAAADEECRPALLSLLRAAGDDDGGAAARLADADAAVRDVETTLDALAWFLDDLCAAAAPAPGGVAVDEPRAALAAARASLPRCALLHAGSDAFYGAAAPPALRAAAASLAPLRGSDLLAAVWRAQLAAARRAAGVPPAQPLPLERVLAVVVPAVRAQMRELWSRPALTLGELDAIGLRIASATATTTAPGGAAAAAAPPSASSAEAEVALLAAFALGSGSDSGGGGASSAVASAAVSAQARELSALLRAYARRPALAALAAAMQLLCAACASPPDGDALGVALCSLAALARRPDASLRAFAAAAAACDAAAPGLDAVSDVVRALGSVEGAALLDFLRAARHDDLRALIDAVEERGDSVLRADTVDDAIKVKRALGGLLALPPGAPPGEIVAALLPAVTSHAAGAGGSSIAARVANCAEHAAGLRRLHAGLADRSGLTRATVGEVVARGVFCFSVVNAAAAAAQADAADAATCSVAVRCGAALTLDAPALHDVCERAVLLQHERDTRRERAAQEAEAEGDVADARAAAAAERAAAALDDFLFWMEQADTITACVSELRMLGCSAYRTYDVRLRGSELEAAATAAAAALADWRRVLAEARQRSALLTCFSGPQLWALSDALLTRGAGAPERAAAAALLQLAHPGAALPAAPFFNTRAAAPAAEWLAALAGALDAALAPLPPATPDAADANADPAGADAADAAQPPPGACPPGAPAVIACDACDAVTALAGIFAASFPAASPRRCQLLVCERDTTDEQVAVFLLRASLAPGAPLFRGLPFVVAHVERLSEGVHLQLVERLAALQRAPAMGAGVRLALLCDAAAGRRAHLLEEYAGRVVEEPRNEPWWPAAPAGLLGALGAGGGALSVVTSPHPGLGKTELVQAEAAGAAGAAAAAPPWWRAMPPGGGGAPPLKTLLLSGEVRRDAVVDNLLALQLAPGQSLHVLLGDVRDAPGANMLLYELTQLRALPGSARVAHLAHVSRVLVEVANPSVGSVAAVLARLPLLGCARRRECGFALADVRVGVTLAATPDVHIVCLYLQLLDAGTADAVCYTGLVPGDDMEFLAQSGAPQTPAAPLPPARCHELLLLHYLSTLRDAPASYAALGVFIRVLAAQLRRFSTSMAMSALMLLPPSQRGARSAVLSALVAMARDFAQQSVSAAREMQASNLALSATQALESAVRRMDTIVRFDATDSTLLLLDADGDIISLRIAAAHAPIRARIDELLRASTDGALEACDVAGASDALLLDRLHRMVQVDKAAPKPPLVRGYVLTADNLLKMAMIYLRISSGTPAVILGETGCGKTSLMHNLARVMGLGAADPGGVTSQFQVLDFHAGITEAHVVSFVERCENIARAHAARDDMYNGDGAAATGARAIRVVAFLDEVNTCALLGLVTELVCGGRLAGRPVHAGVTFVAAVNPYRLRATPAHGAGLQHAAASVDPLSRLVYRVHPLPETMLTHVWDFGRLSSGDEARYLDAMMRAPPAFLQRAHAALATALLVASHAFLAEHEADCASVSLRDPVRFRALAAWFRDKLALREAARRAEADMRAAAAQFGGVGGAASWADPAAELLRFGAAAASAVANASTALFNFGGGGVGGPDVEMSEAEIELRAIVLACAHCYRARLATTAARAAYLDRLAREINVFSRNTAHAHAWFDLHVGTWASNGSITGAHLRDVILSEQLDYLRRMTLPPGTASNEALRENVFTLLVCILNRIPVFVVGKPGCSKSLAMRLIAANLRGADSRDEFFRGLPGVYVLSWQGSFDSTSDGVRAVFDKARRYAATNPATAVIPVVLLDEVGLAEVSPHNPLKVLHALLETRDGSALPYAVVGISNWSLDAAKMNRAVLLSRPDPTTDDLYNTAVDIVAGVRGGAAAGALTGPFSAARLRTVACAYAAFQAARAAAPETASSANFFGLRDYYALCKHLARLDAPDDAAVALAIRRCFGGMHGSAAAFEAQLRALGGFTDALPPPPTRVTELVRANLADPLARHLLLVSRGDAALGVLHACFPPELRKPVVLIGSTFEGDGRASYTYEVLSKIILYMETGQPVCLYRQCVPLRVCELGFSR